MAVTFPDETWDPDIGEWFPTETPPSELEEDEEED